MIRSRTSHRISSDRQLSTVGFASDRDQCPEPSPPIFFSPSALLPKAIGGGRFAVGTKSAERSHCGGLGGGLNDRDGHGRLLAGWDGPPGLLQHAEAVQRPVK